MTIEAKIRKYIADTFFFGEPGEIDGDDSLLESGVVDSTGVMELVVFLEGAFGIQVLDEDLVPENLDSVNRISSFVRRKTEGQVAER